MALDRIGRLAPLASDSAALAPARPQASDASFADALGQAIQQVDGLQQEADRQATGVAQGGGNLHETALALERADIALRVVTRVRNKVIEAYQELMRMPV